MSDSASEKPIAPDPRRADECVTENLPNIYVFMDVKALMVREPPHPAVQEWIRQHQYLLLKPEKDDKEGKDGKDETK